VNAERKLDFFRRPVSECVVPDPRISVVTPSYNQGQFIEQTILSVLEQKYPELEYQILDGGSQDGTVTILQKYDAKLSFWRSGKDSGQAAAINEGFQRSSGDILCWLNSDDLYLAHTLDTVAKILAGNVGEPLILYGGCELFDDRTGACELRPAITFDPALIAVSDFLDQPSTFWTRKAWEIVGPLDESLHYGFDWEWFIRASKVCHFVSLGQTLSRYRIHALHKSRSGGKARWLELLKIVRMHSSPDVIRNYEYLLANDSARWWLNKRMRMEGMIRAVAPGVAAVAANVLSPPFWFVPSDISREMLWKISGIR
jgi:glycosyltransferase involved in cell wall biosynthesis